MQEDHHFHDSVHGIDLDWYAIDSKGQVALLTSAGFGPVPFAVSQSEHKYDHCVDVIDNLPIRCEVTYHRPCAAILSWVDPAQRGLFVYDYSETKEFSSYYHPDKPYLRQISPRIPLSVVDLPAEVQGWLKSFQFSSHDFAQSPTLFPQREFAEINLL